MTSALASLKAAQKAFIATPSAYHWRALEAAMLTYQTAYHDAQSAIVATAQTTI